MPGSELIFLLSPNDGAVIDTVLRNGLRAHVVNWRPARSDYSRKMNYGYRASERQWLLLGAQDIRFHPGWDVEALRCALETGRRVIGTNDIGNPESFRKGSFSTHPLVARSYADEMGTVDGPGALVAEVYDHNWVDRELAETAAHRGEWFFCRRSVVEHLHPHWGKAVMDSTYHKGLRNFGRDRRIYQERRRLWGAPRLSERRRGGRART
jgi:hypothetical protein